jgi:hypothetical protein
VNVVTVWVDETWGAKEAADFVNDLSRWIVEAGYGTNGPDESLRSIVTATEVEMRELSQEEFVQLVAGGQGIVVIPRADLDEPEAYIPPVPEPPVPGQMELDDYARGFSDGHAAGISEGYDQGWSEGWDAASKAAASLEEPEPEDEEDQA